MIAPAVKRDVRQPWRTAMVVALLSLVVAIAVAYAFQRIVPAAARPNALRTIAVGVVANVGCALVGTYLVLRRMSLLGDAISHAVLPGIVLAIILTGRVEGWPILAGAMLVGIITALAAQGLQALGGVSEDSSLGVVYTSLFALGVVMLQVFAPHGHIDTECILYGAIDVAGLSPVRWLGIAWPRALFKLLPVLGIVLVFIVTAWKELKIVSFDAALARAMGMPALAIHLALMGVIAMVTVASFESVGSILVVPMLIAPAATARLLSDRLSITLVLAAAAASLAAILGYLAAYAWNTSVAGMMATVAGLQLGLAVLFSPWHGLVSRWLRNLSLAVKIAAEDLVARLYRAEERGTKQPARNEATGWLLPLLASARVRWKGWTTRDGDEWKLTTRGRQQAQSIVRAHRLWESYLAANFDLAADHLHAPAERMEHFLTADLQQQLASELAGRAIDPHGSPIPPESRPH
jgi:manganese/zinc/iron transport system permease protein